MVVKKRLYQAARALKTVAKINKKALKDDVQLPNFQEEKGVTLGDIRQLFRSGYAVTTLVVWYTWYV